MQPNAETWEEFIVLNSTFVEKGFLSPETLFKP
jgi:hypothetical protein